jgi:hypothetical protein
MSALAQKADIRAAKKVMSALPPKADMCSAKAHVCFGPKADSTIVRSAATSVATKRSLCLGWNNRRTHPVLWKNVHD